MFKNVNLREALESERELLRDRPADKLLHEAFNILYEENYLEYDIRKRLDTKSSEGILPLKTQLIREERVFTINEIRNICVKYRLRFLESSMFKSDLPHEAISEIKRLEVEHKTKFKHFKILAPSEAFELQDCDKDPALFIEMGSGMYYLVHQWGKDMEWYRALLLFPFRNITTLALSIAVVSLVLSMMVPTEFIEHSAPGSSIFARGAFFLWSLVSISAVVTYLGLAFFKNTSSNQWDSPFFKQHF